MPTAFEDYVNTELPKRLAIAIAVLNNYARFTGTGKQVEARTPAQVLADIGALDQATADTLYAALVHATRHKSGGADEVATATPGANAIPKAGAGGKLAAGWIQEVLAYADLIDDPHGDFTPPGHSNLLEHADIAPVEGFVRKTGAGAYTAHKSNMAAAVNPAVTDDSAAGYSIGSEWFNTTADTHWVCLDAAVGAAAWKETTAAGGGGGSVATDVIWDAAGDLAVGTGADTAARLAVGAANSVLQPSGGTIAWTTTPTIGGLLTLNAGAQLAASQQIKDSGGTGRILPATASPHLTLTGDTKIASGNLAIRGTIDAEARININETVSADAFYGIRITPTVSNLTAGGGPLLASGTYTGASGTPIAIAGVQGVVAFRPAWVGGNYADGLNFRVTLAQYPSGTGTATADLLTGVTSSALVSVSGASKRIDVTDWWNIYAKQPQISLLSGGASTVATYIGVYVEGSTSASLSNITTAYGVRIGDSTTPGTVYLLEVGPTTPYLRVVGKAAPAANRTNLYLAEGVTPTLRQVAWEDSGAAGGAGLSANRKVLYLV